MTERPHHIRGVLLSILLTAARAAEAVPDADAPPLGLRGGNPILRSAFWSASREARRKLRSRRCGEVFEEFRDKTGATLARVLDGQQRTPEDHFARILFYGGDSRDECVNPRTLAFTAPGSRAVFLCLAFARQAFRDVGYSADILIHEELHTLGLGENPPSSGEITVRIEAACD
jgi:hypothetical protein